MMRMSSRSRIWDKLPLKWYVSSANAAQVKNRRHPEGEMMNRKCTEIREGLRKLEFEEAPKAVSGPRHVLVEFVRPEPFGP